MTSTTRTTTRTDRRRQRGVALILVLWTFAALAVLAAEFARAMHDEAASTRNFKDGTAARYVAMAGLNEVILALRASRQDEDTVPVPFEDEENLDPIRSLSQGDGQWVTASFRGYEYEVRVVDEAGKIGLNAVDAATLRAVFANLDLSSDDAEVIADSIVDWRDEDDLRLPNGAESDYYESLPRPYSAKNAPFDSVEELLLVRGVTNEVFYGNEDYPGIREIFSVFNRAPRINLRSVTPAVMQALGGMNREDAAEIGRQRRQGGPDVLPDELRNLLAGSTTGSRIAVPTEMSVEARVFDHSRGAVLAHVGVVLQLSSSGDGLRVYRWYDSIFGDSDDTGAGSGRTRELEEG